MSQIKTKSKACTTVETSINIAGTRRPTTVRINKRATRLIVRVDPVGGRVLVTAPNRGAVPDALAFARSRSEWIVAQLEDATGPMPFAPGVFVPFRGVLHRIKHEGPTRSTVALGPARTILVGGDREHVNRRVTDWLKKQARLTLTASADRYAAKLRVKHGVVRIRDTRSRWGSCTREGTLTFSWRLVLAPPEILDYVAAHEVAHLVHLDHSPSFWKVVKGLGVDQDKAKEWFDHNGQSLFAWGAEALVPAH